jgi:hypothetical protein
MPAAHKLFHISSGAQLRCLNDEVAPRCSGVYQACVLQSCRVNYCTALAAGWPTCSARAGAHPARRQVQQPRLPGGLVELTELNCQ